LIGGNKLLKIKNNKLLIFLGILFITLGILIFWPAKTKNIVNSEGELVENSVAEMEKIKLGGVDQWLVIRGQNINNPVLLMLSGGPGSSELGRFLEFNKGLEDDFIVVNWEQRGCGKSYPAIKDRDNMKVEQYVEDINELTNYLKARFNKEKIYLLGHSWGTIIGTKAVVKYPDQFHAYIGAAQMVNVKETDKYMYNYVLEAANRAGDQKKVDKLKEIGEPPYFGDGMLNKYRQFLTSYADYYHSENPFNENREWYSMSSMILFDEYSFIDKIRFFRGMLNTFPLVYQQLQELDFVVEANEIDIPVYYMMGRHDYTAQFIEEYFENLKAPKKELIWFENSAHGQIWSEADKFESIMKNRVLAENN